MSLKSPCAAALFLLGIFATPLWAQTPPQAPEKSKAEPPAQKKTEEDSFWDRISLETSLQCDVGRYGTRRESDFLSVPLTLGYDHAGVVASLTVPYDVQRSRGDAVRVGGRVVRVGGKLQRQPKTEAGLGDLLADAGYYLFEAHDEIPYLLLEGEVKFPTADDERGLGTGSYDETLRLTSGATFWEHLKVTLELGYGFIGQPEDIPSGTTKFHDTVYFGGGVGYKFSASNLIWAKFDGSTRIVDRTRAYELVLLEYEHFFKDDSRLLISVGKGVSSSAPGIAFELAYLIWF